MPANHVIRSVARGFLTEAISTKTVSTASYRNRGQMSIPNYSCVEEKPQHTVDRGMSLEERRHRDETASMKFMMLGRALQLFTGDLLQILRLQATSRYRPIAFDPEGSSLDHACP
jgi:hypothetical protein